jgi:hypothetical protein
MSYDVMMRSCGGLVLVLGAVGCAHATLPDARVGNPIAAGKVEQNRILHTNKAWEQQFQMPPGTGDETATLVEADAQKACFELVSTTNDTFDLKASKFELRVDNLVVPGTPEVTADDPTTKELDGTETVQQGTGEMKPCSDFSQVTGKCADTDREKTKDVDKTVHFTLTTYHVHICYPNPGLAPATKLLMLSTTFHVVNESTKADPTFSLDSTSVWRWGFGPGDVKSASCEDISADC